MRRDDVERFDELVRQFQLFCARDVAGPTLAGLEREGDVLADGKVGNNSFDLAVFRAKAEPMANGVQRRTDASALAVDEEFAGVRMIDPENKTSGFGTAGAEQSRKPQDFAFGKVEVEWFDGAFATDLAELEK